MKSILFSLFVLALFVAGCDSKQEHEQTKAIEKVQKEVIKKAEEASQKAQELSKEAEQELKETAQNLKEEASQTVENVVDESQAPIEQTKEKVAQATTVQTTTSGKDLFVPCIACHGANGKRKALNSSQVIAGWEVEKTINALQGYKDGTYGGNMKASMVGQVARLSDEDIQKLAQYINTL